jgi:Vitamin K-dependent gamma-carboxylase
MRHLIIFAVSAALIVVAVLNRNRLWQSLREFWSEAGSPYNLALFRIVLFATFFFSVNVRATLWYSRMPVQLRFAPFGLHKILPHIPITPQLALVSAELLLIFCLLAAVGFLTRFSAAVAALLGLYVLGLPNFYSKVNHLHHHLIWFGALMAASPCADVLSIDALIRSRRRSEPVSPANSLAYALPLRFVWLLMGIIYFFPGLWKLWHVGFSWTGAENIKLQMYTKWSEFGHWIPAIRIDRQPLLCAIGGIGVVLFEISFLPLVFSRRCRPWLAIAGLAFHNFTGFFMRIWFAPLQAIYVSLVNWDPVFRRMPESGEHRNRAEVWPQRATAAKACASRVTPIIFVGSILLLTNIGFGMARISEAWPFACFPAFDFRAADVRHVLTLAVEKQNGEVVELDRTALSPSFPPDRERGLEESILRVADPARQLIRLRAFWQLWRQNHPELRDARTVTFYYDTFSTIPDSAPRPLEREPLATIPNAQ